jgi:CSLREA domain-containing protein
VRRLAAILAALGLSLALAPSAFGANFLVNSEGDVGDATPDGTCDSCTLREAIDEANATGNDDSITFAGTVHDIVIASTLDVDPPGERSLTISDAQGDVTITETALPSTDPLLDFGNNSDSSKVDRVIFTRTGGVGIQIESGAQDIWITRSPIYGAGIEPIKLIAFANRGVAPPTRLKVGPRQADGSLPVTANAAWGVLELFKGDPRASAPTTFVADSRNGTGDFNFTTTPELQPGDKVAATVRYGNDSGTWNSTSAFSQTATVPLDIVSPVLLGASGTSQSQVRIQPSEPIDPGSVQLSDFRLDIAGQNRPITSGTVIGGGQQILLNSSSPWRAGEAGFVSLTAAGALADQSGNVNTQANTVRVAASPGDLVPPAISSFRISPTRMCLTKSRRCRRPGMTVTFIASEEGEGTLEALRGRGRRARRYDVKAGRNRLRFDGRFRGRKLRAGRYQMHFTMEDIVGNEAQQTPLKTFYVKRTTR